MTPSAVLQGNDTRRLRQNRSANESLEVALARLKPLHRNCVQERIDMNDKALGLDRNEVDLLISGFSDEALEIAAGTTREKANFTLGACSGLSVCPG